MLTEPVRTSTIAHQTCAIVHHTCGTVHMWHTQQSIASQKAGCTQLVGCPLTASFAFNTFSLTRTHARAHTHLAVWACVRACEFLFASFVTHVCACVVASLNIGVPA